jgi:hypothetical protein
MVLVMARPLRLEIRGAVYHPPSQRLPPSHCYGATRRHDYTERYLRLTIADLKEAHAKFHPRENETSGL